MGEVLFLQYFLQLRLLTSRLCRQTSTDFICELLFPFLNPSKDNSYFAHAAKNHTILWTLFIR